MEKFYRQTIKSHLFSRLLWRYWALLRSKVTKMEKSNRWVINWPMELLGQIQTFFGFIFTQRFGFLIIHLMIDWNNPTFLVYVELWLPEVTLANSSDRSPKNKKSAIFIYNFMSLKPVYTCLILSKHNRKYFEMSLWFWLYNGSQCWVQCLVSHIFQSSFFCIKFWNDIRVE